MCIDRKILMVLNENSLNPTGGLGVHVRDNSNEMSRLGADIIVMGVDYAFQQGGFYFVRNKEVEKVDFCEWIYKKGWYRVFNIFNNNDINTRYGFITKTITEDLFIENMVLYLKMFGFNIIHLHDSCLWRVAKNFALYFCSCLITTCHLSFTLCHNARPESPYYMFDRQIESSAFHKSNKVISVSSSYGKRIKQLYLLPDNKITTIYNGVDFEFLKEIKYNKELKDQYQDKPLIVFVGRLVPSKGVELIFKAIKKMKNYHFVLISSIAPTIETISPIVTKIKKMLKKYKNFEWLNNYPQDKKWEMMKIADIGLMPSTHEPFGIVALEWMALGVPLMVTQVDGLEEFCNNKNAVIIKPTEKDIIEKVKAFQFDSNKIVEGYKTVKKMTWKRTAEKTLKVYEEVLK